jgi:hypothetical protein
MSKKMVKKKREIVLETTNPVMLRQSNGPPTTSLHSFMHSVAYSEVGLPKPLPVAAPL